MTKIKLIHDIQPARTLWEKYYAKMEYKRIMWNDLWQPVKYVEVIEWTPRYERVKKIMDDLERQWG